MFTRNDLIDLIMRHLSAPAPAEPSREAGPGSLHPPMLPKGRPFLSEHEIKKRLTPQAQELTIAREALLSPLAADWLVLKGIKIIRASRDPVK